MATVSELLRSCLAQLTSLISSAALSSHSEEVPLQGWKDELGRLRVWAANIGAHQTGQSSLDYRLRDASHIRSQTIRLLEGLGELLKVLEEVLEEDMDDESPGEDFEDLEDIRGDNDNMTEIQQIHKALVETITNLYQMSMVIRKPAPHDRLVGIGKPDIKPYKFWAKKHASDKYPYADELVIDRIGSAMARQRAILKYRERHHAKLSQGIDPEEENGQSTMLSETVATDMYENSKSSDMISDAGISETLYSGSLLDGTGGNTIPPLPKEGANQAEFECPYCFFIITIRDKRAWARHIFRDLMPYVCIFSGCSTPNKLYESRRQWYHHVRQSHSIGSIMDGSYDCSICKQGSLPAVDFERHVGKHLEELALFLLPRTTSDEDNSSDTDRAQQLQEIGSWTRETSEDDLPADRNAEERNDMGKAPTSWADFWQSFRDHSRISSNPAPGRSFDGDSSLRKPRDSIEVSQFLPELGETYWHTEDFKHSEPDEDAALRREPMWYCFLCNSDSFRTWGSFKRHLGSIHGCYEFEYHCPKGCGFRDIRRDKMEVHLREKHDQKPDLKVINLHACEVPVPDACPLPSCVETVRSWDGFWECVQNHSRNF